MDEKWPDFEGWMLWNMVHQQYRLCGATSPDGIFEDQPEPVQAAWKRSATELQQRAKVFGRLI